MSVHTTSVHIIPKYEFYQNEGMQVYCHIDTYIYVYIDNEHV